MQKPKEISSLNVSSESDDDVNVSVTIDIVGGEFRITTLWLGEKSITVFDKEGNLALEAQGLLEAINLGLAKLIRIKECQREIYTVLSDLYESD